MCLRKKKSPNLIFGKGSRESRASMSSTVKKWWDSKAKWGFVSRIQPAFISFLCH